MKMSKKYPAKFGEVAVDASIRDKVGPEVDRSHDRVEHERAKRGVFAAAGVVLRARGGDVRHRKPLMSGTESRFQPFDTEN